MPTAFRARSSARVNKDLRSGRHDLLRSRVYRLGFGKSEVDMTPSQVAFRDLG